MNQLRGRAYQRILALFIAILLPIIGVGVSVSLYSFGLVNFLILGAYALPAVFLAPFLYQIANIQGSSPTRLFLDKKSQLVSAFFISITMAIITATHSPRPNIHFISLSVCLTIVFLIGVSHQETALGLVLLTMTNIVFFLATTLTNGIFIGSGDSLVFWIGLKNSFIGGAVQPTAGYQDFPLWFVIGAALQNITGLSSNETMYALGAGGYVLLPFGIVMLSDRLGFLKKHRLTPAIVLSLTYNFYYISTYSIPRTLFAQLTIVVVAIVIPAMYGRDQTRIRFAHKLTLVVVLVALLGMHKVGQIWLIAILIAYFTGYGLYLLIHSKRVSVKSVSRGVIGGYGSLAIAGFCILYGYWLLHTQIIHRIVAFASVFATAILSGVEASSGASQGTSIVTTEPYGLASTFVASGIVLIFFLTGIFALLSDNRSNPKEGYFAIVTLCLAGFYFPGPIHALRSLMGGLSIYRFAKFILPWVAVSAAVGLVRLWITGSQARRVLLIILVLTGGIFTFANDLYSRDNSIATSGTFKNYHTPSEQAAIEFSISHSGNISSDLMGFDYMAERIHLSNGWGGPYRATPVTVNSTTELCSTPFLFRKDEMQRRGFVIIPFVDEISGTQFSLSGARNVKFDSQGEIPGRRNKVYSSGGGEIWGAGRECHTS